MLRFFVLTYGRGMVTMGVRGGMLMPKAGNAAWKWTIVNIAVGVLFCTGDILLLKLNDWADEYSLGAELVLGMAEPMLLGAFGLFYLISLLVAIYKAVKKQFGPLVVLFITFAFYALVVGENGLCIKMIKYYFFG